MKYAIYTLLTLSVLLAAACSNDPTDKTSQLRREALLAQDAVGIWHDGEVEASYDRQSQQLYVDPTQTTFRILDDEGEQYLEVRLSGMPAADTPVTGTIRGNVGMQHVELTSVMLLRSTKDLLWLWSEEGHWGLVLPWTGI